MPIRKRDFTQIEVEPETDEDDSDNVTEMPEAKIDLRGTFDPANDPYPGSGWHTVLGLPKEQAGPVLRHIAYTTPATIDYPNQESVQNSLARLRMPWNKYDSVEDAYRKRIRSPLTGIRAFCVECKGGSPKAVKQCDQMECTFWAFRMGKNTYRGRR